MRQDNRIGFHDCRERIRDIREDAIAAFDVVDRLSEKIEGFESGFDKRRVGFALRDTKFHLQEVRRCLRTVLDRTDTSSTLPDEEIDTPSAFSLPSGPPRDLFISLSGELKEIGMELEEELFPSIAEQCLSGFTVEHMADAVKSMQRSTECIDQVVRLLADEESDTGKEKRLSGSTYEVLPRNQGFQLSAGQG